MADGAGVGEHRDELLSNLSGTVVEVGSGPGSNFIHYPATVREVIALEPEPYLRERSFRAPSKVPVRVLGAIAEQLPIATGSVDAVVFALVLCSVTSPLVALHEAARILRDGGQLRFYEHVRSLDPRLARRQDRVDLVWPHIAGGCHCNRDTESYIAAAGFRTTSIRHLEFRPRGISLPVSPHVIGSAVTAPA